MSLSNRNVVLSKSGKWLGILLGNCGGSLGGEREHTLETIKLDPPEQTHVLHARDKCQCTKALAIKVNEEKAAWAAKSHRLK